VATRVLVVVLPWLPATSTIEKAGLLSGPPAHPSGRDRQTGGTGGFAAQGLPSLTAVLITTLGWNKHGLAQASNEKAASALCGCARPRRRRSSTPGLSRCSDPLT